MPKNLKTRYISAISMFLLVPAISWGMMAPIATTKVKEIIDVVLDGAISLYGFVSAETSAVATAISTQPGTNEHNPPSSSRHFSTAEIAVSVPNKPNTLATFEIQSKTVAAASRNEPLFAKSYVYGKGSSANVILPGINPSLNFNWQFKDYGIRTTPAVSLSKVNDTLKISSQPISQSGNTIFFGKQTIDELKINSSVENGNHSSSFSHSKILKNDNKVNAIDYNYKINKDSSLKFNIPLLGKENELLLVKIEHVHTEYSIEAPAKATNQTEEKAGNKGTSKVYWDPVEGKLSFSPFLINVLNNGESDFVGEKYINDPLNGGSLIIDPLLFSNSIDGVDYFKGDQVMLIDRNGKLLLRASLPTVVFDDSLYDQNGFNLFAPILNILEVNSDDSQWIQDYLYRGGLDSLLLHELFVGFDAKQISWKESFEAPANAFLSYTGIPVSQVPEPNVVVLFFMGALFFVKRLHA